MGTPSGREKASDPEDRDVLELTGDKMGTFEDINSGQGCLVWAEWGRAVGVVGAGLVGKLVRARTDLDRISSFPRMPPA